MVEQKQAHINSDTGNRPHGTDSPTTIPIIQSIARLTLHQLAIVTVLGVYLFYLGYRLLYTINPHALTLSFLYYYAEAHGFLALTLYFFQLWNPTNRVAPPAPAGLTVDVLIPTYNEDITLLRKTALSCMNMNYPVKVYFLDDGNRPALAECAKELGCHYFARDNPTQYKAGNQNFGLSVSRGEFVMLLDADYVPHPHFLSRTLGYFRDATVAFVQTPHTYYNVDSFQFWVNPKKRDRWNEQDTFYRLLMPGRDYWNAAFFAGTSAVIRRTALEDIGLFATDTITEDLHTSLRFYQRGWKGIYHNEVLSHGLAATNLRSYHQQKLRWAEGNINLLYSDNPLTVQGLTLPQRICFFATVFGWFVGLPEMIYFLTPAVMLLTGWYPIYPFDRQFLLVYMVFLSVLFVGFKFVSRGYGRVRFNQAYNMANFFVLLRAVVKSLFRWKSPFHVTSKGPDEDIGLINIGPQLVIGLLCLAGFLWGLFTLYYGMTHDYLIYSIGIFWAAVNGSLAVFIINKTTKPYTHRKEFRFIGAVPAHYTVGDHAGMGISKNLNEMGVSLCTFLPLELGETVSLCLYLGKTTFHCQGKAIYQQQVVRPMETSESQMYISGVAFEGLSQEQKDHLTQFCFHGILPQFAQKYARRNTWSRQVLDWYSNRTRFRKRAFRNRISLPCYIKGLFPFYGVANDVSTTGVGLSSHRPIMVGETLEVDFFTPKGPTSTAVEIRSAHKIGGSEYYLLGAKFLHPIMGDDHPLHPFVTDDELAGSV